MFLTPEDLAPFADIDEAKALAMIEDAEAMAVLAAPCIAESSDPAVLAAVKAILRTAILRWNDSGSGAVTQQTAGPFSQTIDTTNIRRGLFWPSEVDQLRNLCTDGTSGKAFEVDTMPASAMGKVGVDYWWSSTTDRFWL